MLFHTEADFNDASHLFSRRVVFASPPQLEQTGYVSGFAPTSGGVRLSTRSRTQHKPARDFDISPYAREHNLESLVRRSCVPDEGKDYTGFTLPVYPDRTERALLTERLNSPLVLAALLETAVGEEKTDSAFWLPAIARNALGEWARVAFAHWRKTTPELFPETAEWLTSDEWGAPTELEARRELAAFEEEELRRRQSAEARRGQLTHEIAREVPAGEAWRALLTATGNELVSAVKEALEAIGFAVIDADSLPQHSGKKREDLRVNDGEWTALVEVKGYFGAAKSNDLQQLTAASATYAVLEHALPDSLWYIVNQYREMDPAQRPLALAGREEDLTAFAENHHLSLIDTTTLFRLRQKVVSGAISASEARAQMKEAVGRMLP